MAGVNKAIIVGRLGSDPEIRYMPDGTAVANFSIATSDEWKDKNTGEKMERTEWHRVVAFRRLAEVCGEYLQKGRQVYIEGKLRTKSWEKDGITRYATQIEAFTMQMLGSNGSSDYPQSGGRGQRANGSQQTPHQSQPPFTGDDGYPGMDDDDIPF